MPTKITPGAVLRAALHSDTVLASDGAGGYCWPEFLVAFDAVYTAAKLLELLATSAVGLRELRAKLPKVGYAKKVEFCPWEAKGRVMRTVMERHLGDRVDLTDGVKITVDGGWVLVVPDADRPAYLVIASTPAQRRSQELVDEYGAMVRAEVGESLPRRRRWSSERSSIS